MAAGLSCAVAALGVAAAPGLAAWEPAKRIDHTSPVFLDSPDGDVAVGGNGLATIFFWQRRDGSSSAGDPFMTRRATGAAAYGAPVAVPGSGNVDNNTRSVLAAAPDGSAVGGFQFGLDVFGTAWGASAAAPSERARILDANNSGADLRPDLAVDGAGNGYAVSLEGPVTPANEKDLKLARFDAASGQWQAPETIDADTDVRLPRIAVNGRGDVAVSYVKPGASRDVVVVRRRLAGEGSFTDAHQVSQSPASELNDVDQHDIAIAPDGTIVVVFAQNPNDNVVPGTSSGTRASDRIFAVRWFRSASTPRASDAQTAISSRESNAPAASFPEVVADPAGRYTAVWHQATGSLPGSTPGLSSAELLPASWTAPQRVTANATGSNDRAFFDHAVDAEGTATVVWNEGGRIMGSRRAAGGTFTDAEQIDAANAGEATGTLPPKVAAGPARQADAFFIQEVGDTDPGTQNTERNRAFATRFAGTPPEQPGTGAPAQAGDCPAGRNLIVGGAGNDGLDGTAGPDNIFGRAGNDRLAGRQGDDCLRGEDGDDDLGGDAGNDDLGGGTGNDMLRGNQGKDVLTGDQGADVLFGGESVDRLIGGDDADRLSGGPGADEVQGGPGADRLFLGSGSDFGRGGEDNDLMSGGSGRDVLFGEGGDDRMSTGGGKTDELRGGDGNDRLRGGRVRDFLVGDAGRDRLFGLSGRDLLIGGEGLDVLKGNAGNDRLFGRDGDDRMRGGSGADMLKGGTGDDKLWGDSGRDTIRGSSGEDLIHAADGRQDAINCGRDRDRVIADSFDRISRNCERVRTKRARSRS